MAKTSSSAVPLLARRFLVSKSSDRFLSLISFVSVVGVTLGVLALVVVTSVINGFEGELIKVITGMNGDVILYTRGEPISDSPNIEEKIRKTVPEVQAITATFVSQLMTAGTGGAAGAVLEGIDLNTIGQVTSIPQKVIEGRLPTELDEVALGFSLADRIAAHVGSEIRIIIPFFGDGDTPKSVSVKVVGLIKMGMHDYDSKFMFTQLKAAQELMGQSGKVTSFAIKMKPGTDAALASKKLSEYFGYPFRAKDWGQMNKNVLIAIKLEKVVIAIIMAAIVIVAAFNVVSTLMMMIHDKTKEIAILKAMGFKKSQSFRLFCLIGMGIGIVGVALGISIGLGLSATLERTKLIQLPADIYYIGFLPVAIRWQEIALIGIFSLLTAFAATLFPAIRVSSQSPLDGIRYE